MRPHAEPAKEKANESLKTQKMHDVSYGYLRTPFLNSTGPRATRLCLKKGKETGDISTGSGVRTQLLDYKAVGPI